jgi:uncharacterized protein (DUF58 family)
VTSRAFWLGLVGVGLLLAGTALWPLTVLGAAWLVGLAAAALLDWLVAPRRWTVDRRLAPALSLAAPNPVELRIRCESRRPVSVRCRDETEPDLAAQPQLLELLVPGGGEGFARYRCLPRRRGAMRFGRVVLRAAGPLNLWRRQCAVPLSTEVLVLPALHAVGRWEGRARRSGSERLGSRGRHRYGEGTEFAAIRDYVVGDDPRRVNWRATARLGRPMTSQYEPERSRPIWLVLDCGRLMASGDGDLSKLDVALSSALLLAWVALSRGDRVGALAVASAPQPVVPPRAGRAHYRRLQEGLSRLRPELVDPDWSLAALELRRRQGPRALVVSFTDLSDPDMASRLAAAVGRLRPRHLPLVVTQRDLVLERERAQLPEGARAVYRRAAALRLLEERQLALDRLVALRVPTVDSGADGLGPALIDRYLDLKARGAI